MGDRKKNRTERINVSIPTAMIEKADQLATKLPHFFRNRQNFIEKAISDAIEKYDYLSRGITPPDTTRSPLGGYE